ncbi:MAG: hypothetical protein IJ622_03430 [Bacteroidales bacterium]|nr:hypothetical protein [Bacteroidales bacterium]
MRIKSIVIIVALFALSSCSVIAPVVFGLRQIDGYNAEQCAKFYKKLPNDFAFTPLVCDKEQFWQVSNLGADSMQMHDLYQPLKIMYFHDDTLVSLHINCYCPPTLTFNLSWNYKHQFDVFPPSTSVAVDSYTLKRSDMQAIFPEIKGESDYTVLVFWTDMLHKISRSEIKTVYRNLKKHGPAILEPAVPEPVEGPLGSKVEVYLINNDIPLSKLVSETE